MAVSTVTRSSISAVLPVTVTNKTFVVVVQATVQLHASLLA